MDENEKAQLLIDDLILQIDEAKDQLDLLKERLRALETAAAYHREAPQIITAQWQGRVHSDQVANRSQREILSLLAKRNRGWIVASRAILAMTNAGIYPSADEASPQVYTLLRSSEFEKVFPGIYRFNENALANPSTESAGPVSLTERIQEFQQKHPDWDATRILAELQREGWDFGDKKPMSSVTMGIANLAKRRKNGQLKLVAS